MAPGVGQSPTQHPQNQHSSGYSEIGGRPFSGLGTNTPERQLSTQVLQPLHNPGSNSTFWLGVIGLGTRYALLSIAFVTSLTQSRTGRLSLKTAVFPVVLLIGPGIRRLEPVTERQFSGPNRPIVEPDSNQFLPFLRVHFRVIQSLKIQM
jgi:hypothetical protein